MASIPFAVPPSVVDVAAKTARMQRRLDIDPEISAAATATYSAPLLTVAFAPAPTEREAYIAGVIFRAVFLGEVQGVDAQYLNEVQDPRSLSAAANPTPTLDVASGCNVGSRLYDGAGTKVWGCLDPVQSEALWTRETVATEPYITRYPSDFAAGAYRQLGRSLQPDQFTQVKSGIFSSRNATQRNAALNLERTQIFFNENDTLQVVSLANGIAANPEIAGTGSNPAAVDRFRFKLLNSSYLMSRRGISLIVLFQITGSGATAIQNYSTGIGTFNRNLSVTYDRKYFVVGDQLGGEAFFSAKIVGLTAFPQSVSLVGVSGPFTPLPGSQPTCLECTRGPPSLVFFGYVTTSASYLYYLRLVDATGAINTGSVTAVSAYTGGSVYTMTTTTSGYVLLLDTTSLYVLRYSNSGATITVTQVASAAHGMTMVLSGSSSGNTIDSTVNTDAITMSDDSRQIAAVSTQVGEIAIFSFDPDTGALALVAQPSLPAAITGAAHQSIHYMANSESLAIVSLDNTLNVLY